MKYNISRGLLALACTASLLASCSKDEERAIVTVPTVPALTASSTDVSINADDLAATALTLTWGKASLGYDKAIVNYELLISRPDQSSTTKDTVTIDLGPGVTQRAFTGKELNTLLSEKLQAEAGTRTEYHLQLRISPYTTSTVKPRGSNVAVSSAVSVHITTAAVLSKSLDYFFVGSMFASDNAWNINSTAYPLFLDTPDGKVYTYTGKFAVGSEFKLVSETSIGNWGGVLGKASAGMLTNGGDNIKDISALGYYTFTFTPASLSYSVEAYDATSSAAYAAIGLIGSAVGGWGDANEIALTRSTYDLHIWSASGVAIQEGELKIRANKAWNKSWGGKLFPVAKSDSGDNIKVSAKEAGTYYVVFNDLTGHYHFRKQ